MPAEMPPKLSADEIHDFGERFAAALDKGKMDADKIAAQENAEAYRFGKQIEGKYSKPEKK